jgi:hypothetical protein
MASLEPRWSFAARSTPDPERLRRRIRDADASRDRAAALGALHRHAPEVAAEALTEAWPGLAAKDKVACLHALEPVDPADEALLEAALDDRAKTVRAAAADRLAHLPNSELVRRSQERLRKQLVLVEGALEMVAPTKLEPEAERDGVVQKPPSAPHGARISWVEQTIARVPPARLEARFRLSPEALIEAAHRGKTGPGLILALSAAALRHRDAAWAEALVAAGTPAERSLLGVVPAGRQEDLLKARLGAASNPQALHRALTAMADLSGPISPSLARAAVGALERLAHAPRSGALPIYGTLRALALHVDRRDDGGPPLTSLLEAFGHLVTQTSPWYGAVEEARALLRRRRAIDEAFAADAEALSAGRGGA